MSKSKPHNHLDNFLKESFKEHTIKPAPELWDKIEGNFQPKVVPIHQYARLKLALYASAIVIAGLVAVILFSNKKTLEVPITPEPMATEQHSAPSAKEQITEPIPVQIEKQNKTIGKTRKPVLGQPEQNTSNINLAEHKEKTEEQQLAKNNQDEVYDDQNSIQFLPIQTKSDTSNFSETNRKNESAVQSVNVEEENKTIVSENNTSAKKNKDSATKHSNSNKKSHRLGKHHTSKNNLQNRNNYTNYSQKGKRLENFTLKLNITPTGTQLVVTNEDKQMLDYHYMEKDDLGFTFNGGIELEYRINEKWSVYTGVKTYYFKQTFEEFNYTFSLPFQNNQPLISRAGKYLIKSDNIENIPSSVRLEAQLKLRFIDIPLVGRYNLNKLYFDGGINYSYLIDNYSNIVLENSSSTLSLERNGGFKKHTFGFIVGAGYKKTFNSGLRFEVGPEIKFATNNLYTGEEVSAIPLFIGFRIAFCVGRYYSE